MDCCKWWSSSLDGGCGCQPQKVSKDVGSSLLRLAVVMPVSNENSQTTESVQHWLITIYMKKLYRWELCSYPVRTVQLSLLESMQQTLAGLTLMYSIMQNCIGTIVCMTVIIFINSFPCSLELLVLYMSQVSLFEVWFLGLGISLIR